MVVLELDLSTHKQSDTEIDVLFTKPSCLQTQNFLAAWEWYFYPQII